MFDTQTSFSSGRGRGWEAHIRGLGVAAGAAGGGDGGEGDDNLVRNEVAAGAVQNVHSCLAVAACGTILRVARMIR